MNRIIEKIQIENQLISHILNSILQAPKEQQVATLFLSGNSQIKDKKIFFLRFTQQSTQHDEWSYQKLRIQTHAYTRAFVDCGYKPIFCTNGYWLAKLTVLSFLEWNDYWNFGKSTLKNTKTEQKLFWKDFNLYLQKYHKVNSKKHLTWQVRAIININS